jgi:small subunit ribosomal protein S10e
MFMPTGDRLKILSFLFKEGVLCVKKDVKQPEHHLIEVPNLFVLKLMLSMKSRGYVREVFNWQWHYYFLTDEGVEYLRSYLHLPAEIVPATHKKPAARPAGARARGDAGREDRPRRREGGYRTEGGFGRGAGRA